MMVEPEQYLKMIEEHGGGVLDLSKVDDIRAFVKEIDVILRNPKSGSVPGLEPWMREPIIAVNSKDITIAHERCGIKKMILDLKQLGFAVNKDDIDPFHNEMEIHQAAWNNRRLKVASF